ncbi:MAG TPA: protein-methionine-sulfoxide reductase catalytic subunit MsrP [Burkholderiales bacterium]
MLIKQAGDLRPSEITDRGLYLRRREFIQAAGLAALGAATGGLLTVSPSARAGEKIYAGVKKSPFSATEEPTSFKDATSYNNYYEFGTDKESPERYAGKLKTRPWTVAIEGEVKKPKIWAIDDLLKSMALQERIYRMRCVEGWSMVIPWVGFALGDLIRQAEPTGKAKFVEFVTANQPDNMPGLRFPVLDWPYIEGLRLDEAMHPLTILAVGLYGEVLPNQNGAPIRLVVPWKYGFKGGKSIVRIRFVERMPQTAWMKAAPREYGFYSNVNPEVDHPRWSQAKERRIGEFLKRNTLMFNGYADQVAGLYTGMDLKKNF